MIKSTKLQSEYNSKKLPSKKFKSIVNEWKVLFLTIHKNKQLAYQIVISSGDYISINFIYLLLVPMVRAWYQSNIYMSVFDSAFAIGAMFSAIVIPNLYRRLPNKVSYLMGLSIQSSAFSLLIITNNLIITTIVVISIGIFN